MASTFKVVFTQYKNQTRVMSSDFFYIAEDFKGAFDQASDTLNGMKVADPDASYEIASIAGDGYSRNCPKAEMGFKLAEGDE